MFQTNMHAHANMVTSQRPRRARACWGIYSNLACIGSFPSKQLPIGGPPAGKSSGLIAHNLKPVQSIPFAIHPLGTQLILLLIPRFPCLSGQLASPPRVCSCPPQNRRDRRALTVWRRITPKPTRARCNQSVRSSRTSGKRRRTWSGSVPWRKCQRQVPFEAVGIGGAMPTVRRRNMPSVRRRNMT